MEAASARYAARDRFGPPFGEPVQTPLQRYILNAVDPQNFEPNLALDLEIADLVNSKKGNAPREAAVGIVKYVNHRNPNVSMLAITLLDICVKNCGYPFHLQISTKEFLNELVRRFPERPPLRYSRVQQKILEMIEEWRQTICQTSKYKEDLGFIRDMHRLLSYKGYMFPEIRPQDAAVLNPSDDLKSAEEMEEEERAAQSAKLQELIRRGGPEDLQEANKLMKVMAGYDQRNKTDYRAKAAEEVGLVQQKAKLLEERLQNFKAGDRIEEGDVFEDLANALQSAHPKIQKMCEEESDDQEAVAKLFEINDSIHRTIERYRLIKKGDIAGAQAIPQGTLGTTVGVGKNANQELSLIDFGGGEADAPTSSSSQAGSSTPQPGGQSLEDDLLGLSFSEQSLPYGQGGNITLGLGANQNIPGPPLVSSSIAQSSTGAPRSQTPQQQQAAPQPQQANYDAFSAFSSRASASSSPAPFLPAQNTKPQQAPQAAPQVPPQATPQADPFGMLGQVAQQNPAGTPPGNSMFNFASAQAGTSSPSRNGASAPADDEFEFSSAVPEEEPPSTAVLNFSDAELHVTFEVSRGTPATNVVNIVAKFSNKSMQPISEFTFQVAVTKTYSLKLTPQSGRKMGPNQQFGITQPIEIHGVARGEAEKVKIRWKASYKAGEETRQVHGEVPPLGIA